MDFLASIDVEHRGPFEKKNISVYGRNTVSYSNPVLRAKNGRIQVRTEIHEGLLSQLSLGT